MGQKYASEALSAILHLACLIGPARLQLAYMQYPRVYTAQYGYGCRFGRRHFYIRYIRHVDVSSRKERIIAMNRASYANSKTAQ